MSSNDLDRVQKDLSYMRDALRMGLPWSEADARFTAAIAVAAGVYAALSWPVLPWPVTSAWAAAPLAATLVAYLTYIALKVRRLPQREESRRREYRATIIALAVVTPVAMVYGKWGKYIGLTPAQLAGCVLALMGAAFFVVGVATPPARYPRSYLIAGSLPLMLFGLLIPIAPASYAHSLIGLMGLAALGVAAFITHRHVRRYREETAENVRH